MYSGEKIEITKQYFLKIEKHHEFLENLKNYEFLCTKSYQRNHLDYLNTFGERQPITKIGPQGSNNFE